MCCMREGGGRNVELLNAPRALKKIIATSLKNFNFSFKWSHVSLTVYHV